MLRTNLSTRPFYNERAVHLVLGLVALVVVGLTVVNLVSVVRLSRQNTVLGATMREDRSTAEELTRKARQTRQEINQEELKVIVAAAREANALIDGRTFSWTALFNQLESTLPPDVMLSLGAADDRRQRDQDHDGRASGGGPPTSTSSWRSSRRRAHSRTSCRISRT